MSVRELRKIVRAADGLLVFLSNNTGESADWPVHITVSPDFAMLLCDKMTVVARALGQVRARKIQT